MNKKIMIDGMSCGHCSARVEKALAAVDGVTNVKVSLEDKCADLTLAKEVADAALTAAVMDAGYTVTGVR